MKPWLTFQTTTGRTLVNTSWPRLAFELYRLPSGKTAFRVRDVLSDESSPAIVLEVPGPD